MKKSFNVLMIVALLAFCGCKTSKVSVQAVGSRPGVIIADAPKGAILFVDSKNVGPATNFGGKKSYLELTPGTHKVVVKELGGRILWRETIYVDDEVKTIYIPSR